MWRCRYEEEGIHVFADSKDYGYYHLIEEPYCQICSYPEIDTDLCTNHDGYYGLDRIHAMGRYYPARMEKDDLLTFHILGIKKFRGYARPLGLGMYLCIVKKWKDLCNSDFITFVPKMDEKLKTDQRKDIRYNQAEELAKVINSKLKLQFKGPLIKLKQTSFQDLSREERYEQVKGAYGLKGNVNLQDAKILLVDDVATSLATSSETAQILKDGGAKEVNIVVAGRAIMG